MIQKLTEPRASDNQEVLELLARRAQVQEWLRRLEEHTDEADSRIVERVRLDYEGRLRETVERLSTHREEIRKSYDEAGSRLEDARSALLAVRDRLEEGRLRNLIGELDDDAWEGERERLEREARDAVALEDSVAGEVARLSELLEQLDEQEHERRTAPSAGAPVESAAAPIAIADEPLAPEPRIDLEENPFASDLPAEEELYDLEGAGDGDSHYTIDSTLEEGTDHATSPGSSQPVPFLAEIDRALTGSGDDTFQTTPSLTVAAEDTAPKPGLKCGECGYTNDLGAWFCGVCGADVG
jgi:hypothetical protein